MLHLSVEFILTDLGSAHGLLSPYRRWGNGQREPKGLAPDAELNGLLLGEAESQGPRGPAGEGVHGCHPHVHPWHRWGIRATAAGRCQAPHCSHSCLCPRSQNSPQATLVMSALGRERGAWGWGRAFQKPPRLSQRKAASLPRIKEFSQDSPPPLCFSQTPYRVVSLYFHLLNRKQANIHPEPPFINKITLWALWEELLRSIPLKPPDSQNWPRRGVNILNFPAS